MSFSDANNFNIIDLNCKLELLYLLQKPISVSIKSNNVSIVSNVSIVTRFTYSKSAILAGLCDLDLRDVCELFDAVGLAELGCGESRFTIGTLSAWTSGELVRSGESTTSSVT